jgi:uncharacterized membrane protein YhaH (DUF805 family)
MDWTYLFVRFDGRISRQPYWIGTIALIVVEVACFLIGDYFEQNRLIDVIDLAFLYPEFAIILKRANDRDMRHWIPFSYLILSVLLDAVSIFELGGPTDNPSMLYWVILIPLLIVALYLIVDLGFRKGTNGPNRYGPDPLAEHT